MANIPPTLRAGGMAELSLWVFGLSGGAKLPPNKPFDPTNAPYYHQSIAIAAGHWLVNSAIMALCFNCMTVAVAKE